MLNHNIIQLIISKSDQLTHNNLYKVNKICRESIIKFYKKEFENKILPKINYPRYIQYYHVCDLCKEINSELNYYDDIKYCDNCSFLTSYCLDCGKFGLNDDFRIPLRKPYHYHEYVCKDNCEFICLCCDNFFSNKDKVIEFGDCNFICKDCIRDKGFVPKKITQNSS